MGKRKSTRVLFLPKPGTRLLDISTGEAIPDEGTLLDQSTGQTYPNDGEPDAKMVAHLKAANRALWREVLPVREARLEFERSKGPTAKRALRFVRRLGWTHDVTRRDERLLRYINNYTDLTTTEEPVGILIDKEVEDAGGNLEDCIQGVEAVPLDPRAAVECVAAFHRMAYSTMLDHLYTARGLAQVRLKNATGPMSEALAGWAKVRLPAKSRRAIQRHE